MADATSVSGPVSGTDKTITFTVGVLAPQSQGAVIARIGDTQALATANGAKEVREGTDFFPLTVDVEEKAYAAGKIPGSFFRREGRPSDNAVLVCRLIDRPLRPSFPAGYRNETQVVITVLGADQVNPYDVIAINAASASLMLTGLPFEGPIGAASALKMSYAGITKGVTALGAAMMLAATRNGAAQGLRGELERGQATLLPWFQRSIPAMYSKAYRFVGEMEEIADFVGEDPAARKMFEAIAEFYTRLAADFEGKHEETDALSAILKKKE